jgi:hypothetical protein
MTEMTIMTHFAWLLMLHVKKGVFLIFSAYAIRRSKIVIIVIKVSKHMILLQKQHDDNSDDNFYDRHYRHWHMHHIHVSSAFALFVEKHRNCSNCVVTIK